MRIFLCRSKRFFMDMLALLFAAIVCMGISCGNVDKFPNLSGRKTFYLYSASSQATVTEKLRLQDIALQIQMQALNRPCHFLRLKTNELTVRGKTRILLPLKLQ